MVMPQALSTVTAIDLALSWLILLLLLGLPLVAAATIALVVGIVNYPGIGTALTEMDADLQIP